VKDVLIGVTSFGSVWRRRFGKDPTDPEHFRRAAYFNTTGVRVGGRTVRHRKIAGHVRFNGTGGFNPHYPQRMISSVFEADEPCIWNGQNKVFLGRRLNCLQSPDYFLVALRSSEFGRMDVGAPNWKSEDVWLISFSEWGGQQEALLLVPPDGWVRTALGCAGLSRSTHRPWLATISLAE
jgi:hypothetical protein